MGKIARILEVEKILWASNTLRTRELPKTAFRGLHLILEVTHTNGASPSISTDSFLDIIKDINIVINGQDNLQRIKFRDLYYINRFDGGVAPVVNIDTTASAQKTSKASLYLPFILTRSARPNDTVLDARNVSSIVLEVNWGSSIGTDVSVDSAELKIFTDEYANYDEGTGRKEVGFKSVSITSTGETPVELDVGSNNEYRRLIIFTEDSNGNLSNSIIDEIRVTSRSFDYMKAKANTIQERNVLESGLSAATGVYVVDFTRDGKMSQRLDAKSLNELFTKVNSLVSSGTVRVVYEKAIFS